MNKNLEIQKVMAGWKRKLLSRSITIIFYIFRVFPIKRDKVVFSNFDGKGYGDNPKYIYKELKKIENIDAVWLISSEKYRDGFPSDIRLVRNRSLQKFYELATAGIWVDNCRKSAYVRKRKHQYYIMTWHAGLCLKKVEKDAEKVLEKEYIMAAKKDARKIDLMISNCKWCTNLYRKAFWYTGEILEGGIPRNDIFFCIDNRQKQKIKKYFNIKQETKLVIYAPTFRRDFSMDVYNLDIKNTLDSLEQKFHGKWKLLLRLHPSMGKLMKLDERIQPLVIDVSEYGDIYELLAVCDVLITDYSSISFDFANSRKPVFLYTTDMEAYYQDRGTYFNLKKLPFPFSDSNKSLTSNILNFEEKEYLEKLERFFSKVGLWESGHASKNIADKIVEYLDGR